MGEKIQRNVKKYDFLSINPEKLGSIKDTPLRDILLSRSHVIRRYRNGEFNKVDALIIVNMLGVEKKEEHMKGKPRRVRWKGERSASE